DLPTNITMETFEDCCELLHTFYDGISKIRRIFVTLTNLRNDGETQLDMFYERPKQQDIGMVMDSIRGQSGSTAILRACSYTTAGITLDRSKKRGGRWA